MQFRCRTRMLNPKQIGSMKRFILCTFIVAMFAACTQDATRDLTPIAPLPEKVYASITTDEELSRVHLDAMLKTVWDEGDYIAVIINGSVGFYGFVGTPGSASGEFAKIEDAGSISAVYNKPYAMYSKYLGIAAFSDGSPAPMVEIPSVQNYMAGSYDGEFAAPMIGVSELGDLNFEFKQMCGFLRLQLTGSKAVRSIKLTSRNEILAGVLYTFLPPDPEQYTWYKNTTNEITLNCTSPVQLTQEPTHFYIVMAPGEYEAGLNMTVTFSDGTTMSKASSQTLKISPNTIQPIRAMATDSGGGGGSSTNLGIVRATYNTPYVYLPIMGGSDTKTGSMNLDDGYIVDINSYIYYMFADSKTEHTVVVNSRETTSVSFVNCHGLTDVDFSNF